MMFARSEGVGETICLGKHNKSFSKFDFKKSKSITKDMMRFMCHLLSLYGHS